jgi:integrative and conjugative element protein (TIGR02256 family)
MIYIVDTVPSPPDSEEWPTLYIRGRKGLRPQVENITNSTDGMVEYIGEWHSHPDDVLPMPSSDDHQVFSWITEIMDREGLPAVMMIVGGKGIANCFVSELVPREICIIEGGVN